MERARPPFAPKDGVGPRGAPECYYTSRALNSTAHHARFVRRLRAHEAEQRRAAERTAQHDTDLRRNSFLARCDRRSLINTVADRVDLCLASYDEDLAEKRQRLAALLTAEERSNIRAFVSQAQEGAALLWSDRRARLDRLLADRRREHRDRHTDTPVSKCAHIYPCLVKLRAKEVQEALLYQMREKQLRRAAEHEFDKMWHDVAMSESDALAARLAVDAVERRLRDLECTRHAALQVKRQRQCREEEREVLRREALALQEELRLWRERQAREKDNNQEKSRQRGEEGRSAIVERQELVAAERRDAELVRRAWDSLQGQSAPRDRARELQRRQKERDLDECNRQLMELKHDAAHRDDSAEALVLQEGRRRIEAEHLQRCRTERSRRSDTAETSVALRQQFEEQLRRNTSAHQHELLEHEYECQVRAQLEQLVRHKELTEAQARKLHRADLSEQINYNELLKERALQEEIEQRKKCELARQQYQEEIREMLCRPPRGGHPFTGAMSSVLRVQPQCVCAPPTDTQHYN